MAKDKINTFLDNARFLLRTDDLTPLQKKELDDAIASHLQHKTADLVKLEAQRARIDDHWASASGNMTKRALHGRRLNLFAYLLWSIVWSELFKNKKLKVPKAQVYLKYLGNDSQRQEVADVLTDGNIAELDNAYQMTVLMPIAELLLDREHVEMRMRNALAECDVINTLLEAGDAVRLQEVIKQDLYLSKQLSIWNPEVFEESHRFVERQMQNVLRQLDKGGQTVIMRTPVQKVSSPGIFERLMRGRRRSTIAGSSRATEEAPPSYYSLPSDQADQAVVEKHVSAWVPR